jgi:hypothetical protein
MIGPGVGALPEDEQTGRVVMGKVYIVAAIASKKQMRKIPCSDGCTPFSWKIKKFPVIFPVLRESGVRRRSRLI